MADYQLSNFIGKKVQIDRGGPESKSGIILAVGTDYLVLATVDEGNLYYYIEHIKSITLSNIDIANNDPELEIVTEFNEKNEVPETMKEIFAAKKYKLIQINRGGPEKIIGLLTEIYDDYVAIVAKEEVILVVYSHIKSCSFAKAPVAAETTEEAKKQGKSSQRRSKK